MPMRLDIKRKLLSRSDRVKSVDLHPTEPWVCSALYDGNVHIWNIDAQQLIKTFEVSSDPIRAVKFVARKNWIITGSDDMNIRVFNYNTIERVYQFEAHSDYIRSIAIHPIQSFILTCSDDMLIRLWDWENNWKCIQKFEGHTHYVMQLVINPKDNNTFASASLDHTIKVWNLGSGTANFTLEGHDRGVNCLDYYTLGDKPYLVSGSDDKTVKVWDYQTKACVQTLDGHAQNISSVQFHPELPIILTGSEDGTIRIWHSSTYHLESTLNYGLERVWTTICQKGKQVIAIGYDEGTIVISLGRDEPAISMDSLGKIVCAKHAQIVQANLRTLNFGSEIGGDKFPDGERLPITFKEMGTSDIYPHSVEHNANGRFVAVYGDGEYIVYTAMALRNKTFGQALEFVWSQSEAGMYAVRENNAIVKVFKQMKELHTFKLDYGAEQIFGGFLLGVGSLTGLTFYDWTHGSIIRRIDISPKSVYWNELGQLVALCTTDACFVLRYFPDEVPSDHHQSQNNKSGSDGFEKAFQLIENGEISVQIRNGRWFGDAFIFTTKNNRLCYYVGGEMVTLALLDRPMYLLGYLPKENRVFLADRELQKALQAEQYLKADRAKGGHLISAASFPTQPAWSSRDPLVEMLNDSVSPIGGPSLADKDADHLPIYPPSDTKTNQPEVVVQQSTDDKVYDADVDAAIVDAGGEEKVEIGQLSSVPLDWDAIGDDEDENKGEDDDDDDDDDFEDYDDDEDVDDEDEDDDDDHGKKKDGEVDANHQKP